MKLTPEEKKAIEALKRVAKIWPKSLWIFAGNGGLYVMRNGEDGKRAVTGNGNVDPDYWIDNVNINADGGDW